MLLFIVEDHRLLPRRQIKQEIDNGKPGRTAKPTTTVHTRPAHGLSTQYCPTKITPFRHSHLLWPVSGLTSDPPYLPMQRCTVAFEADCMERSMRLLTVAGAAHVGVSTAVSLASASCFPFNRPSGLTGEHQSAASVGKIDLYVNVNQSGECLTEESDAIHCTSLYGHP